MPLLSRRSITLALAGLSVALTATGVAIASASTSALPAKDAAVGGHHVALTSVPADNPRLGLIYRGLIAAKTGKCVGAYQVTGGAGLCTHGPDAPFPGYDVKRPVAVRPKTLSAAAVPCDGDGQTGNRVQVLYVREQSHADRSAQYLSSFRGYAADVDAAYNDSAAETGGTRHVRFVTDASCNVDVTNVVIPDGSVSDFGNSITAVKNAGANRSDRKYLMFVDSNNLCGVAGVAIDDQPGQANRNNSGQFYARVDNGCWGGDVATHELTHTMGSVSSNSPNPTQYGHCTDDYDVMCYQDGPGTVLQVVCSAKSHDRLLDCNHDDYFSTNPTAGSWLANHWNTANNKFLITSGTVPPPTSPSPSPTNSPAPPSPSPTNSPAPPPSTGGQIVGMGGKCIDVRGSRTANGTAIQLYDCNGGASQKWTVGADGSVKALGKCLDVPNSSAISGTRVQLYDCNSSGAQKWTATSAGELKNAQSGKCLDIPGANTANRTQLIIWDCHGGANQKWAIA